MCFYIQYQFACGDLVPKLRRRCNRVYPQENSCSSKIASETFYLQSKCSLCSKIATYRHGQQQEEDQIQTLESKEDVDEGAVQRSIGVINQLQNMILALELARRDQRVTVSKDDAENHERASLGPGVENADLLTPNFASNVTKFDFSAQLNKLEDGPEDGHEKDEISPKSSPSTARAFDARQVAEWKTQTWSKYNETPLAKAPHMGSML